MTTAENLIDYSRFSIVQTKDLFNTPRILKGHFPFASEILISNLQFTRARKIFAQIFRVSDYRENVFWFQNSFLNPPFRLFLVECVIIGDVQRGLNVPFISPSVSREHLSDQRHVKPSAVYALWENVLFTNYFEITGIIICPPRKWFFKTLACSTEISNQVRLWN